MRRPFRRWLLLLAALVWAADTDCRRARAAVIDRPAEPGQEISRDGFVIHTFAAGEVITLRLPGDDLRFTVAPATTQPAPVPTPDPADTIRRTVQAKTPVFLRSAVDARWDMSALPDGTPARSYLGPFFAWAFDNPGTYKIIVTPGADYLVTVTDPPSAVVLRLPGGRQTLRKTLTTTTHIVAADPSNPPIINGGFQVEAPNCYFANLIFDGDVNVNGSAIRIGRGGSAYIDDIELRSIGNGIHAEVPTILGVVARNVRAGSGVRKYPFAMFAGHDFALYDFQFTGYRGIEHCIRIDANNGATPHDGIIAYGRAERVNDNKEPATMRRGERVAFDSVTFLNGYAVRLFYSRNDYLSGTSKDIYIRRCTFDSVPLYVNWWGSDGLMVADNQWKNLGGDTAIHYNAGGGLRNVKEMRNRRDGSGPMHKGEGGIPGYVYQP